MKRYPVKPSKDKKIFKRTATRTRKVNLSPNAMRGGIRL